MNLSEVGIMKPFRSAVLIVLFLSMTVAAQAGFISEITEMTFHSEVLECDMPVLVWFFFSEGLVVNDKLSDALDKVAMKNIKRMKILKMDSKYNIITMEKYKIRKNNTFVIFIDGAEKARSDQIRSDKEFNAFIDANIPK
jgi:thioredoxin-like negative regulator of GroEL